MRLLGLEFPLSPESDTMLSFDALRFIAAAGIVIHHSNAFLYPAATRLADKETSWGLALLVDLFFLISGYVIAFVYGGRTETAQQIVGFLQKRVARLFPLHIITLIIFASFYMAAAKLGMSIGTMPDLSPTCFAKTALMLHAIIPCEGATVNAVSWSISAEMLMYALFPVLFLIFGKRWQTALIGCLLSLAAIILLSADHSAKQWTDIYAPIRALPSFIFGLCLFQLAKHLPAYPLGRGSMPHVILWTMVAAMFVCMMYGASATVDLIAIYAVCMMAVLVDHGPSTHWLLRATAGLGRLTYGIYMIHLLFVTALVNVLASKMLNLSYWPMIGAITITSLIVLIASIYVNIWIETPLRKVMTPRLHKAAR